MQIIITTNRQIDAIFSAMPSSGRLSGSGLRVAVLIEGQPVNARVRHVIV